MQDKHTNGNRIFRFVKEKGYYIVLILCVAAVGISGYFFIRTAVGSRSEELVGDGVSVSVPVRPDNQQTPQTDSPQTAEEPDGQTPSEDTQTEDTLAGQQSVEALGGADAAASTVLWPLSGETTRAYSMQALSYNPTMRDWRTHDGIDIAASEGQTVRAAMAGTVSAVYDDDFLGTVVEISHVGGYTSCYANLTRMPTVSVGDEVSAGQTIGAVGTTALGESAQAAHLHFAVSLNGESIDPAEFLP